MFTITLEVALAICFLIDEKSNISMIYVSILPSHRRDVDLVFEVGVILSKKGNSSKEGNGCSHGCTIAQYKFTGKLVICESEIQGIWQ